MPLGLSPLSTICCVGTDLDAKFATNGATPEARALELGPREAQTDHAPCCSVWEVDPRLLRPRFFANSARNCAALIADIIASCAAREGSPSRGAGQPGDRIMSRPERGSRTGYFLAGQVPGPRLVLDRPVPLGGARVPTVSLPAEAASTDVEPPSAPPAIQLPIRFPHRALARARNVENLSGEPACAMGRLRRSASPRALLRREGSAVTGPSAFCALRACPPAYPELGAMAEFLAATAAGLPSLQTLPLAIGRHAPSAHFGATDTEDARAAGRVVPFRGTVWEPKREDRSPPGCIVIEPGGSAPACRA